MSSYTGLRKLHLTPCNFINAASSDEMATRFFAEPFRMNAPSLKDLRISPEYEGLWCFGPHNMPSISQSINIRTMQLSVMLSDLKESNDQAASKPDALVRNASSSFFSQYILIILAL